MLKVSPAPNYPAEEGRFLRGNDLSPVAVAVVLIYDEDNIPKDIETLVRVGVESGAALSGTIQTENIGIEKMVCNIIGNPNIRYLIITGPESPGHSTGEAIKCMKEFGLDTRKRIQEATAPTPYLFNLPGEWVERFRNQIVSIIDLLNRGTPSLLRSAIWSCYQEQPTRFEDLSLHDIGAYPGTPIEATLTWRVANPAFEPKDETERQQKERFLKRMAEIKRRVEEKKNMRNRKDHGGGTSIA
jgi:tetrahydromethanopterin S-methyltransferase subunit A